MRGLPFSLVCAHLHTETQGLRDQVVLNLDNMVDSHCCGRCTGRKLLLLLNFIILWFHCLLRVNYSVKFAE